MPGSIRNALTVCAAAKAPEDWSTPERCAASVVCGPRASVLECAWQAKRDTAFRRSQTLRTTNPGFSFESGVKAAALQDADARSDTLGVAKNVSFPMDAGLRCFGPLTCFATGFHAWRRLAALAFVILLFHSSFFIPTAFGHPADISYLRAKVERHRVDLRFTFNLLTLTRFVAIDANKDQRITQAELETAEPALRQYLDRHIQVRINDTAATLGTAAGLECIWPTADGKQQREAPEPDYAQRYVDFVFRQDVKLVVADIWLGFDIWTETGPLGTIEATYEQEELRMQVPFSMSEPDYLYDTGFAVEDIFQAPPRAAAATAAKAVPPSRAMHPSQTWMIWVAIASIGLAIAVAIWVRCVRRRTRTKANRSGFQPSRFDS